MVDVCLNDTNECNEKSFCLDLKHFSSSYSDKVDLHEKCRITSILTVSTFFDNLLSTSAFFR